MNGMMEGWIIHPFIQLSVYPIRIAKGNEKWKNK
jgi:hypothetical protein